MVQGLYNTMISDRRTIGFCWKHKCYLTATQLRQKECLKKQCNALERYEHEFWRQRELLKARKKSKKAVM
jgi:hypothetical protein